MNTGTHNGSSAPATPWPSAATAPAVPRAATPTPQRPPRRFEVTARTFLRLPLPVRVDGVKWYAGFNTGERTEVGSMAKKSKKDKKDKKSKKKDKKK
ncbi:hypothetical protein Val02_28730 [Virgisporangium aliadipatigenens]|uniref:Uncharacterized protein n=1 Tax=Virgisporangium aliadipatigenens TaxID=741659 RepID=A0A8J4DR52_9ACTN|nr:hypothetical protein Val02_28730 [Virgisporangium aliadipatigenens]